jgi:hypothetical protein
MRGAAAVAPLVRTAVDSVATSPNTVSNVAKAGEAVGAIKGLAAGLAHGSPVSGAAIGAVTGEKIGKLSGSAVQRIALKASPLLEAAAPYVQALSTLSGAQGALDLAQMAEPKRSDIGFLGVGLNREPVAGEGAPLINAAVSYLMKQGLSKIQALEALIAAKGGR